jgi:hypothetical protein
VTDYNEGDLIEVSKGETLHRGRLVASKFPGIDPRVYLPEFAGGRYADTFESTGYTVTLLEKANPKVELPTAPGVYRDANGDHWTLHTNGQWIGNGDGSLAVDWSTNEMTSNGTNFHPLVRLEPRSVTAKAALDRLAELDGGAGTTCSMVKSYIGTIAEEFGVTP